MSRAHLDYRERRPLTRTFEGFDPDKPVAGFYRTRLRAGGVRVGVRIWFGPPVNPDHDPNGDEPPFLDRSPRFQAEVNGRPWLLEDVWPRCADDPIDEPEYRRLSGLQDWGERAGVSAVADPTRRLDPLQTPLMF